VDYGLFMLVGDMLFPKMIKKENEIPDVSAEEVEEADEGFLL